MPPIELDSSRILAEIHGQPAIIEVGASRLAYIIQMLCQEPYDARACTPLLPSTTMVCKKCESVSEFIMFYSIVDVTNATAENV